MIILSVYVINVNRLFGLLGNFIQNYHSSKDEIRWLIAIKMAQISRKNLTAVMVIRYNTKQADAVSKDAYLPLSRKMFKQ